MCDPFGAMDIENALKHYKEILEQLEFRIYLKHDEKGLSYRTMTSLDLLTITRREVWELEGAIYNHILNDIVEEGLDVAICGLLLADWALQQIPKEARS